MMVAALVLIQSLAQAPSSPTPEPPPSSASVQVPSSTDSTDTSSLVEPPPPSAGNGGRTAALLVVGIGLPIVATGLGALMTLPLANDCAARSGHLCGLWIALGAFIGGVAGLLAIPLGLWMTNRFLSAPDHEAEHGVATGGLIGAFVGLAVGIGIGITLVAVGSSLNRSSPEANVALAITGGVIAIAAPIGGAFVGRAIAARSKPQVGLLPLRDGALVTVGATF